MKHGRLSLDVKPTGSDVTVLVAELANPAALPKNNLRFINKKKMASGCSKSFYKKKHRKTPVHFLDFPLKRPTVRLAALKRKAPPVNCSAKVCGDDD